MDLRDVVRDVVWMTRVVGRTKYVTVELSLPETPLVARVAPVQVQQVVLNLLTNAADALVRQLVGEWGGTLEVSSSSAGTTVDAHFPTERPLPAS